MTLGDQFFTNLINGASAYLQGNLGAISVGADVTNPQNTLQTKYGLKISVTNSGALTINGYANNATNDLYQLLNGMIYSYERRYGVNTVWERLQTYMIDQYKKSTQLVAQFNIELPLTKYRLQAVEAGGIFSGSWESLSEKWEECEVLITNRSLTIKLPKGTNSIPADAIASIGREVYWRPMAEEAGTTICGVDYRGKAGLDSVVFHGKIELIENLKNALGAVRVEAKRLNPTEKAVLSYINMNTAIGYIPGALQLDNKTFYDIITKLRTFGYINSQMKITALGIKECSQQ